MYVVVPGRRRKKVKKSDNLFTSAGYIPKNVLSVHQQKLLSSILFSLNFELSLYSKKCVPEVSCSVYLCCVDACRRTR